MLSDETYSGGNTNASPVESDLSVCHDDPQLFSKAQLVTPGFIGARWGFLADFPFNSIVGD